MRIATILWPCAGFLVGAFIAHLRGERTVESDEADSAPVAASVESTQCEQPFEPSLCDPMHPMWELDPDPYVLPGTLPVDEQTKALAQKVVGSLVRLAVVDANDPKIYLGQGTGVVLSANAVLTAWHVVDQPEIIVRAFPLRWSDEPDADGHRVQNVYTVHVVKTITALGDLDAAYLTFDGEPFKDSVPLPYVTALPADGALVYHMGFRSDITHGHIVREYEYEEVLGNLVYSEMYLTAWMPTYRGDSGGPVVNPDGALLGIMVMISGTGLSYAVPMHDIETEFLKLKMLEGAL